jgi:hypothetical protein
MSLFTGADQAPKLEDLVGEGKKYATPEAVAKAVVEKDNFIEQLKRETALLREEMAAKTTATDRTQEILDQLEALKKIQPVTEREAYQPTERTEVKGLSLEDVEKVIQQREARQKADRNVNTVKEKLVEIYGDRYGEAIKQIGEKNGLSPADLDDLAARSPQLVLNLVQATKAEKLVTPPDTTVRPVGGFSPTADGHKTRSWWNDLKATNKTLYLSREMQMRQYKDAMALGESFEDA